MLSGGALQQMLTSQSSDGHTMGIEAVIAAGLGLVWQLALPISSRVLPPGQQMDVVTLYNMAQMGGVSISLAISGAIYENIGFHLVREAMAEWPIPDSDIRELLSGADAPNLAILDPRVLKLVINAIATSIIRCYSLTIAAGALCFIAACFMKFERLYVREGSGVRATV